MAAFIPGLELSELFYKEVVRPLLDEKLPFLFYSAALIGPGSEVLGFDTVMSTDHHWGPRLMLFVHQEDYDTQRMAIMAMLREHLPVMFRGYSTSFGPPAEGEGVTRLLEAAQPGAVNHRVEVYTTAGFFRAYLGFEIAEDIAPADWLTFPQQKLRSIVEGAVYYDGAGLNPVRDRFTFYPHDIWLYLMAALWQRIGQEEHLLGRAGQVGDELGAQIIAARLVRDLMRLCFLMERQYAPYAKWFGTAFSRLNCGGMLAPVFRQVLLARNWKEREKHLSAAYSFVAEMHNLLDVTPPLSTTTSLFYGRPFQVIHGGVFASALLEQIQDAGVKRLAALPLIGSIDLFSDSTDMLERVGLREKLKALYAEEA